MTNNSHLYHCGSLLMHPKRAVLLPWMHHLACKQHTIQDSVESGTQITFNYSTIGADKPLTDNFTKAVSRTSTNSQPTSHCTTSIKSRIWSDEVKAQFIWHSLTCPSPYHSREHTEDALHVNWLHYGSQFRRHLHNISMQKTDLFLFVYTSLVYTNMMKTVLKTEISENKDLSGYFENGAGETSGKAHVNNKNENTWWIRRPSAADCHASQTSC